MNKIDFVNNGQPSINDTSLNQMQTNIENAIDDTIKVETNKVTLKDTVKIEYGTLTGVTVPASSFTAYTVNFSKKFTNPPVVIITPKGNYNIIGQVSYANTNEFVLNARSLDGYERTNRSFSWIAIGI